MSAMEYSGPDRRRGGADRKAQDEITRILVVDDHALFRVGIANILGREPDFEIVAEAEDSRSAVDRALETSPNVILMDLSLPAPGGIETTSRIKRELPSTAIIVLAVSEDEDALFDAIKAGAAAFILKDVAPDDLVAIILALVTAAEVGVYYLEISRGLLIPLLFGFAAVKFALVVLWFMHLRFDSRTYARFFMLGLAGAVTLYVVVLLTFRAFSG